MNIIKGDLWSSKDPIILVTGNSTIKTNGAVVMGRGAALECKTFCPGIDKFFGSMIQYEKENNFYGVVIDHESSPMLGLFQVKYHYKDKAILSLIEASANKLMLELDSRLKGYKVSMNYPGIGFGQLSEDLVFPVISKILDERISVYIYG